MMSVSVTNNPTLLLQYMGLADENQDPRTALADWDEVESRLYSHPNEASTMRRGGISFPLNLALSNSVTPAPSSVIERLIKCYPEALSEEDFGNACRYRHTSGDVIDVLIRSCPTLRSRDSVKRWDLDWVAQNGNEGVAKVLIRNCAAANPSSIKEWKEMRPSSHYFWLKLLIELNRSVVSFQNILSRRILQFFILQGNLENVQLLLDSYPRLLSATSHRGNKTHQLPIHTALSEFNSSQYKPWQNRSPVVRLLLQRGIERNIGGEKGCGGLYVKDSHTDALTYAIDAALNSRWDDEERKKCLQVCLQFAQSFMYNRPANETDLDMPILHAAVGVVQVDTFSSILRKYRVSTVDTDRMGRTPLNTFISMVTNRPENGYTATKQVMTKKKRERERDLEINQNNNRDFPGRNGWGENVVFHADDGGNAAGGNPPAQPGNQAMELIVGRLLDREEELLGNVQLDRWNMDNPPRPVRRAFLRRRLFDRRPNQNQNEAPAVAAAAIPMLANVFNRREIVVDQNQARFLFQNADNDVEIDVGRMQEANNVADRPLEAGRMQEADNVADRPIEAGRIQEGNILRDVAANRRNDNNRLQAGLGPPFRIMRGGRWIPFMPRHQRQRLAAPLGDDDPPNVPAGGEHENAMELDDDVVRVNQRVRRRENIMVQRRVLRARRMMDEELDAAIDIDIMEEDDEAEEVDELIQWRTYAAARNVELDQIQERMIEQQYFESILKILLSDVPRPFGKLPTDMTNCARIKDRNGRLPLHYACEQGLSVAASVSGGLKDIINAHPEAVLEPDGLTDLFPFALVLMHNDLDTAYEILLRNPAVMDFVHLS